MEKVATEPDDFLASFGDDVRPTMQRLDELILEALPGWARTLWEGTFWDGTDQRILGHGDIVQPRPKGGSVEWFLVGLARQAKQYSLYVKAVDDGAYLLDRRRWSHTSAAAEPGRPGGQRAAQVHPKAAALLCTAATVASRCNGRTRAGTGGARADLACDPHSLCCVTETRTGFGLDGSDQALDALLAATETLSGICANGPRPRRDVYALCLVTWRAHSVATSNSPSVCDGADGYHETFGTVCCSA